MIPAIETTQKLGTEKFTFDNNELEFNILNYWQWSASDLITNRQRGILAEFLIASALDLTEQPREEWDAYDLVTSDGLKIEVKSASYIQSWEQEEYSKISFGIQPTVKWEGNKRSTEKMRQSDVYIFCLLKHKDYETVNPMNLNQWKFYILETNVLNNSVGNQKSITLSTLMRLNPNIVLYDEVKKVVEQITKAKNE